MVITNELGLLSVPEGTPVLIDAEIGSIYVQPSDEILSQFEQRNRTRKKVKTKGTVMREVTQSLDGQRITLFANINLLSELELARELKAEGVGLYRSEFPFVIRSTFPSEEEQRVVYARLFRAMEGKPVYVRTLDVGGDKVLPYLNTPRENNPELGLRSIRFSLHYREIFDQQIRAILRAGAHAERLGIMFPMITSIDEFASARQAVMDAQVSLESDGLAYNPDPAIGAMIETPALLPIMDDLAKRVDFFSIGTNDFIQYMLAVDRTNKNVAAYYQPFHPAILRSLAMIINSAKKQHTPISVCGEVAHQTDFLPFLLGIGVRRLSIDPQFLPEIQREIGKIDIDQAEAEAGQLLQAATFADLRKEKQGKVLA
jgi:phosphotransferase system enzyme I (PtsP)